MRRLAMQLSIGLEAGGAGTFCAVSPEGTPAPLSCSTVPAPQSLLLRGELASVWRASGGTSGGPTRQIGRMATRPSVYERGGQGLAAASVQDGEAGSEPPPEELEVMRLMAIGLKDYAIARRLEVSVVTVRRRARSFRLRVGATNRSEAIAVGVSRGWLVPSNSNGEL